MYTLKAKTLRGDLNKPNNHNLFTHRSDVYKPNNHLFPLAIWPTGIHTLNVNLIYKGFKCKSYLQRKKKAYFSLILKNRYIISFSLRLKPCVEGKKCLMQIKPLRNILTSHCNEHFF